LSKISKEDTRSLIKYSYKLNDSWILEKDLDKDILGADSSTAPEDFVLRTKDKVLEEELEEEGGVKKEICLTSSLEDTNLVINLTRRMFLAAHYNTADLTLLED
jgi:hypothetical protein